MTFLKTHYSVIFILHAHYSSLNFCNPHLKKNKLHHPNSIHPYLLSRSPYPFHSRIYSDPILSHPTLISIRQIRPVIKSYSFVIHSNHTHPSYTQILLNHPTLKSYSSILNLSPSHPTYTQIILIWHRLKSYSSIIHSNHTHLAHTLKSYSSALYSNSTHLSKI